MNRCAICYVYEGTEEISTGLFRAYFCVQCIPRLRAPLKAVVRKAHQAAEARNKLVKEQTDEEK